MSMVFYFVSNTCMSLFNYYSIPRLNGNLASAEKCSGLLRFRLRQVLLYKAENRVKSFSKIDCGPASFSGYILIHLSKL
jgi:hypothetical protein